MNPRRVAVIVLLLALVGVGVWKGEAVWWFVLTRQSPFYGESRNGSSSVVKFGGYSSFSRWSDDAQLLGESVDWYADSGYLHSRSFHRFDGSWRTTEWNADGTIRIQMDDLHRGGFSATKGRTKPPWLWGEKDETSPTAPWVHRRMSMMDWYLAEVGGQE